MGEIRHARALLREFQRSAIVVAALTVVILLGYSIAQAHAESSPSLPSDTCLNCHGQPGFSTTLPGGESLPLYVNPESFRASVHGDKLSCTGCHSSISAYPHPQVEITSQREYSMAQSELCNKCHQGVYDVYVSSVHGKALIEKNSYDVPVCTDCHNSHAIEDPGKAAFRLKSVELCGSCHSNQELMQKYGMSTNVVKSYLEDFHGRTVALIGRQGKDIWVGAAVCTDCHGVHDIQAVDNPDSPVIKTNLVKTCATCHSGATTNFPSAWLSHYQPGWDEAWLVFLVKLFYWLLIPFIIIGLLSHVLVDMWQVIKNRYQRGSL